MGPTWPLTPKPTSQCSLTLLVPATSTKLSQNRCPRWAGWRQLQRGLQGVGAAKGAQGRGLRPTVASFRPPQPRGPGTPPPPAPVPEAAPPAVSTRDGSSQGHGANCGGLGLEPQFPEPPGGSHPPWTGPWEVPALLPIVWPPSGPQTSLGSGSHPQIAESSEEGRRVPQGRGKGQEHQPAQPSCHPATPLLGGGTHIPHPSSLRGGAWSRSKGP